MSLDTTPWLQESAPVEAPPCPTALAELLDLLEERVAVTVGPLHVDADDQARAVPGSDEPPD